MAKQPKSMKGVSCVTRKGVEYWYARTDAGKLYCGKGDKGRKMAEAARAKYVAKGYESKEVRAGLKVDRPKLRTVRDLLNWFMTEVPSVQMQKSYYRKTVAAGHLLRHLGDKHLSRVEEDTQETYRQARAVEGAASGTVDIEMVMLRAAYNAARRTKKIPLEYIPGRFVILNHVNPRRTVTEDEFHRLLTHADPDFRDILVCGYESAMRSSEICTLTASQVKLNVHHISGRKVSYIDLGIFDTKTGARRTVPVSSKLKEVLERRLQGLGPDDRVFTSRGRPIHNTVISNKMQFVCGKAGVPHGDKLLDKKGAKAGIVFHSLRHTRTSRWVAAGFSDEIVRRATGHRTLGAYQMYVKLDPSALMRLVEDETAKNGTKAPQVFENTAV